MRKMVRYRIDPDSHRRMLDVLTKSVTTSPAPVHIVGPRRDYERSSPNALRTRPLCEAARQWAHAVHYLADPKPFGALAADFQAGQLELPSGKRGDEELADIVRALLGVRTAEAERSAVRPSATASSIG